MKHRFEKHERQLNRKPENMSKSIRLDVKKHANRSIKKLKKNPEYSDRLKEKMITMYNDIKAQFTKR